jgi:predicted secreted protein
MGWPKGKSRGLQFRMAMSERMKTRHADPEFRAKLSALMTARRADPEFRAKLAAGLNARHARKEQLEPIDGVD